MACVVFTTLSLITAGVFPDLPGWRRRVHVIAAYTMAVSYVPLSTIIASAHISQFARIACWTLIGYMVSTFVVFVISKQSRDYYLMFQTLYIVAFELIIVAAGYL